MTAKRFAVCVFSASSDAVEKVYFDEAEALARWIASKGWTLVFGAGNIGLMGAMAKAAHKKGGHVVGVIPQLLRDKGYCYESCDALIVTRDMRDRKSRMEKLSDAFIAIPGGFGTLEELLELMTLKQLKYHAKPIIILNTHGFYDPLLGFFDKMFRDRFAKEKHRSLYFVAKTVQEVEKYLESYGSGDSGLTRPKMAE